jgi:hypothetical protein
LQSHSDADHLAAEAIHGVDLVPDSGETDSLGEADLN